jgi:hypothetical protein
MERKIDEEPDGSSWYVDDLGAAGFSIQRNEDYASPPAESYGALFLIDKMRMEQNHSGFMRREGPPPGFYP